MSNSSRPRISQVDPPASRPRAQPGVGYGITKQDKVDGGRYCTDAENSWSPSNPYVKTDDVKKLIKAAVAPQ